MKLQREWRIGDFDIVGAVHVVCDGSDSDRGSIETISATADNTIALLAKLIALLHDKGALSDKEVLELLGYGWKIK